MPAFRKKAGLLYITKGPLDLSGPLLFIVAESLAGQFGRAH